MKLLEKIIGRIIKEYSERDIKKMHGYFPNFKDRYYFSTADAIADIHHVVNKSNKESGSIFGKDDPDYISSLYDFTQTKKGVKIDPRVALKPIKKELGWDDFEIIKTSFYELNKIASSNFNDYEIITSPIKVAIKDYIDDGMTYIEDEKRIQNLADNILKNKKFEPIVINPSNESVIEGQHRIRAMRLLGFKTILAYQIIGQ